MSFLKRLFSKPEPPRILTARVSAPGTFEVKVTGLSIKNLDIFWKATSNEWHRKEGERDFYELQADATLVSDLDNRIPHATGVEIGGKLIGQLQHADALRLHLRLKDMGYDGLKSRCDANLVGRSGYWEVMLDLDATFPEIKAAGSNSEK